MEKHDLKTINKLFNRNDIHKDKEAAKVIMITTSELKTIHQLIKMPLIQTSLNGDKVEEMKKKFSDINPYHHHFLACCNITLAHLIVGEKEDYYLVDGQHRVEMALELYDTNNDNKSFIVSIINVKSKDEMNSLFKSINADSAKCVINDYPIFAQQLFEEIKELLQTKYTFIPNKALEKNRLYNITEFIDILIKKNILTSDNCKENYNYLVNKEKVFFNKYDYMARMHKNKSIYKDQEIKSIENKSCMFMKNNNFIEWLIDTTLEPSHDYYIRKSIPKKLQQQVWEKEFNANSNGSCPIYKCENILDKKVSNSWQCGHIMSVANGGTNDLDNLRTICTDCNKKMSSMNWDDYINKLYKETIIEDYFYENETIQCYYKNNSKRCINIVTNENFYPYKHTTPKNKIKIKPVCNSCFDIIKNMEIIV
jgi:hypothetical protein